MAEKKKNESIFSKLKKLKPKKKTSLSKKPSGDKSKSKKSGGTKKKLDAKTKNFLIFGSLAIILIIITVLVVIKASNSTTKYTNSYGDITTMITLNKDKHTITLDVDINGENVANTYEYTENEDGTYSAEIEGEIIQIVIEENILKLVYDDGTVIDYKE